MIDVSSRRPPDRLATARAAHGELESEGVQRSWPSARPTASKTSDGGAAIKGCACWPCGEAFKAPLAVPAGPVQAKGPGCVRPPPDTPGTLLLSGRADSSGAIGEAATGVGAAGKAVG